METRLPGASDTLRHKTREILQTLFFPSWWKIVIPCLLLRMILGGVAAAAVWEKPPTSPWVGHPIFETYRYTTKDWGEVSRLLIDPWNRWDTGWYLKIAASGYDTADHSVGFQPLYPFLIRIFAPLFGWNYLFTALFLSTITTFAAALLLYRIAYQERRSGSDALTSVFFLLSFPSAFFLFTGYTESLFLLLSLSTWFFARKQAWGWAGLFAGLTTLTRTQGIALTFLILWLVIKSNLSINKPTPLQELFEGVKSSFTRTGLKYLFSNTPLLAWLAVLAPAIVILEQNAILNFAGFGTVTNAYGNWMTVITPWDGVLAVIEKLNEWNFTFVDRIDLALLVLYIIIGIVALFRATPDLSIYVWATLALILMRAGDQSGFLTGFMRYMMTTFPVFILLPRIISKSWSRLLLIMIFLFSQLVLFFLFIHWSWVA